MRKLQYCVDKKYPDDFDLKSLYEYFQSGLPINIRTSYSEYLRLFSILLFEDNKTMTTAWNQFLYKHPKRKLLIEKQLYK